MCDIIIMKRLRSKSAPRSRRTPKRRTYRGRGDYIAGSTAAPIVNQLVGGSGQVPIRVNTGGDLSGDVYIHHREFIQNVSATVVVPTPAVTGSLPSQFYSAPFAINVGLSSTFPWLAQVAENFTLYELMGLVFEYRPTSSEYGSIQSNALGKVIMATEYDPDQAPFISSVAMENYDYATSCKPSEHMAHGVETKRTSGALNMLYVRTGPSQKDKIFTDLGLFQVGTEGVPVVIPTGAVAGSSVSVVIGELWVTYKVKLSRANLYGTILQANVPYDYLSGGCLANTIVGGIPPTINAGLYRLFPQQGEPPFGTNSLYPMRSNNIGCRVIGGANIMQIVFPRTVNGGVFQVILQKSTIAGTATTAWSSTPAVVTYGTLLSQNPPCNNSAAYDTSPTVYQNIPSYGSGAAPTAPTLDTMQILWVQVNAPGTLVCSINLTTQSLAANQVVSVTVIGIPSAVFGL
nr:MAG: capsid protein [Cressdnaviricota sp.]